MPKRILLAALFTIASPLVAGPPWLGVELPANRLDPETRGAFLTVRAYHHQTPVHLVMRGTAEGLVNGRRASVPLRYRTTRQTGVYALDRVWESTGVWVLDIRASEGHGDISAIVGVGPDGEAAFVRVPLGRNGAPRTISRSETEELLASLASGTRPPALARAGFGGEFPGILLGKVGLVALLLTVALLVAGQAVHRRRSRAVPPGQP
jgi:hypothetical protein